MGQHSTRLGDISTMQANTKDKGKGTPGYKGNHREKPVTRLRTIGDVNKTGDK